MDLILLLTLSAILSTRFAQRFDVAADYGLAWLVDRIKVDSSGLCPILVLAGGLSTYATANLLGGNGFLAIYLTGLLLGNRRISHRHNIRQFMDGAAWPAQIVKFLLLGLLIFPDQLLQHLPVALGVTLLLIARPEARRRPGRCRRARQPLPEPGTSGRTTADKTASRPSPLL